jgi:hypothetical protein
VNGFNQFESDFFCYFVTWVEEVLKWWNKRGIIIIGDSHNKWWYRCSLIISHPQNFNLKTASLVCRKQFSRILELHTKFCWYTLQKEYLNNIMHCSMSITNMIFKVFSVTRLGSADKSRYLKVMPSQERIFCRKV